LHRLFVVLGCTTIPGAIEQAKALLAAVRAAEASAGG
jgi:hypothetical protein